MLGQMTGHCEEDSLSDRATRDQSTHASKSRSMHRWTAVPGRGPMRVAPSASVLPSVRLPAIGRSPVFRVGRGRLVSGPLPRHEPFARSHPCRMRLRDGLPRIIGRSRALVVPTALADRSLPHRAVSLQSKAATRVATPRCARLAAEFPVLALRLSRGAHGPKRCSGLALASPRILPRNSGNRPGPPARGDTNIRCMHAKASAEMPRVHDMFSSLSIMPCVRWSASVSQRARLSDCLTM